MNLVADYEIVERQTGRWHAGGEILVSRMLSLRAGNDNGAVTLGVALARLSVGSNTFELDYGYADDHIDQSASHRVSFVLRFGKPQEEIALLNSRKKKTAEPPPEPLAEAEPNETQVLTVEKNLPAEKSEMAAMELEPYEAAKTTFEKILSEENLEATAATTASSEDIGVTTYEKDGLTVTRATAAEEAGEIAASFASDERSAGTVFETPFKESLTATKSTPDEAAEPMTAILPNEPSEMTFEEKMAALQSPSSTDETSEAPAGRNILEGQNQVTPAKMTVYENEGLPAAPNDEPAATPKIIYGSKKGVTIPEIAPGKRVGHSLAALFEAQVIEARPAFWIINLGEREGFNTDMMVEIYEPTPDNETGRSYGTAQALEVRSRYSIVKIVEVRSKERPLAGQKVVLKYLYPAVNY